MKIDVKPNEEEKALVYALAVGYTVREIAQMNDINRRTLEAQVDKLRVKFNVSNIPQLVYVFAKNRFI